MSEPVLIAQEVVAGYVRGMPIVHDVSVDVAAGEIVTIIGPNGAGKSTFLKALAGLIAIEAGSVECLVRTCLGCRRMKWCGSVWVSSRRPAMSSPA